MVIVTQPRGEGRGQRAEGYKRKPISKNLNRVAFLLPGTLRVRPWTSPPPSALCPPPSASHTRLAARRGLLYNPGLRRTSMETSLHRQLVTVDLKQFYRGLYADIFQ